MKLNFGCGNYYLKDYINIDIARGVKADIYIKDENDQKYLKFKDVDRIRARKVLPYFKDEIKTLSKWHKMLKMGGIITLCVPHFSSVPSPMGAKRHIGYQCDEFYRFEKDHPKRSWSRINKKINFKVKIKFRLGKILLNSFIEKFINKHQGFYETSFLHNLFPARYMEVEMIKKGGN